MAAYYPISAYTDSLGMSVYIIFEAMAGGGSYQFGLGLYNNPDNAKIQVNLSSPGYTNGVSVTKSRSCVGVPCERPYATGAMRLAYPSQSVADEVAVGSNIIVRIALSEFIYSEDTNITVNVDTGFYTQGGNQSQAVTDLSVTNNSTNSYASLRVIGNNASPQCETVIGTTLYGEISAFHKFGIDCIKVSVSDGTNTVNTTITDMVVSPNSPLAAILVYPYTFNLSSLNDNSVPTVSWVAYPNIGTSSSILNTNDGVNTFPTPRYTNLTFRLDKVGDHGHTCVDATYGNDSTGEVYSSQVLAEAGNAFATIPAAATALQAYHNLYAGHNDAGGGTIYLSEETHTFNSDAGGAMLQWLTITRKSTGTKAGTILQSPSTTAILPARFKIKGITYSGSIYFRGTTSKCWCQEDCAINTTGITSILIMRYAASINCSGTQARGFSSYSASACLWGLVRGNNMTTEAIAESGFCILGNKNIIVASSTNVAVLLNDNLVFAFNESGDSTSTTQISLSNIAGRDIVHGAAIVQNLFKRYGSQTTSLGHIGAYEAATSNNIIFLHNNFVGGRVNFGYNTGTTTWYHLNWTTKNNIFSDFNNKDDTFDNNPEGIGAWPVGYRVGASGNLFRTAASDEWFGEFQGLYRKTGTIATPLSPAYVDDQSADGGNTSGGDYHLQATSPAIGLAHDLVLPYDFEGKPRRAGGATGVYESGGASIVPLIMQSINQFNGGM